MNTVKFMYVILSLYILDIFLLRKSFSVNIFDYNANHTRPLNFQFLPSTSMFFFTTNSRAFDRKSVNLLSLMRYITAMFNDRKRWLKLDILPDIRLKVIQWKPRESCTGYIGIVVLVSRTYNN